MKNDRRTTHAAGTHDLRRAASAIVERPSREAYERAASMLQNSPETILRHYGCTRNGTTGVTTPLGGMGDRDPT